MSDELTHPYTFYYKHRKLDIGNTKPKTPRSIRRQLNVLKEWADCFQGFYPEEQTEPYWHCKIPCAFSLVDERASYEVRKESMQSMIDAVCHVIEARRNSNDQSYSKVTCVIDLPEMFGSEVTVFYDEGYFHHFFFSLRYHYSGLWEPIKDPNRSIVKEYDLKVPSHLNLHETGYIMEVYDRNEETSLLELKYKGEVWAIGEIDEYVACRHGLSDW